MVSATLQEKIEAAFAGRAMPAELIDPSVFQFDSDVEEALWFVGRDWHELKWNDWKEHSCAINFFSPEAFGYYLPSLLLVTAQNPTDWLSAVDALIWELDLSPSVEAWPDHMARRFLALRGEELDALKEWLLFMCEYPTYDGYGISASGPGEVFGRVFDTVELIQKELGKRKSNCSKDSSEAESAE